MESQMQDKRQNPYCNMYEIHCRPLMEDIRQDIKDIKKVLVGDGTDSQSLLIQAKLNSNHRILVEKWWGTVTTVVTGIGITFIGSLIWIVLIHRK